MTENRGTGAGGANTNKSGKTYEDKVDIENILIGKHNFDKCLNKKPNYTYLENTAGERNIRFFKQGNLKKYFATKGIILYRFPDMAIIKETENKKHLIIFEVKNQTVAGSVDTKLWAGESIRREYELCVGEEYKVDYIFILSDYFKIEFATNPKFKILAKIHEEQGIKHMFGSEDDYMEKMIELVMN